MMLGELPIRSNFDDCATTRPGDITLFPTRLHLNTVYRIYFSYKEFNTRYVYRMHFLNSLLALFSLQIP